jgi:Na+-translocating ferredoxin:NAD+ oxidoreductase RnfG subunit
MDWRLLPTAAAAVFAAATPAQATVYLTAEQARAALFPEAARFQDRSLTLSPEQVRAVKAVSGVSGLGPRQAVWQAADAAGRPLGWFIVDRVYGKHEFITYALALDAAGAVRGLEILEYRETYGGEIRNPRWRAQFTGKRFGAALRLDHDIKNISGATLSCRHVTDGVKRLLALHDLVLAKSA